MNKIRKDEWEQKQTVSSSRWLYPNDLERLFKFWNHSFDYLLLVFLSAQERELGLFLGFFLLLFLGCCHRCGYGGAFVAAAAGRRIALLNFWWTHVRARRQNGVASHRGVVTLFFSASVLWRLEGEFVKIHQYFKSQILNPIFFKDMFTSLLDCGEDDWLPPLLAFTWSETFSSET